MSALSPLKLALRVCLFLFVLISLVRPAEAQTGSISGQVVGNGSIAIDAVLRLYNSAGANIQTVSKPFTTVTYSFTGLAAGTYYLLADGDNSSTAGNPWVREVWQNQQCLSCTPLSGTPIMVGSGAVTNINFDLELGGQIAGFVYSDAGVPVEQLSVRIYSSDGTQFVTGQTRQSFEVGGAGSYRIGKLPAGSYRVRTISTLNIFTLETLNFFNEAYNDIPCHPTCDLSVGTLINVTAGSAVEGITFNLEEGGKIQGTVTGAGGAALSNVTVQVFSGSTQVSTSTTNASGAYSATQLRTGPYFVRTVVPAALNNYIDELYNNLPCASCSVTTGTPVNVVEEAVTSGIDFALELGGSITGTVTNAAGGAAIASISVRAITASGGLVKAANTNASGQYSLVGLPAGSYYIRTQVSASQNYVDELYNNVVCIATCATASGTVVPVTAGNTASGINLALNAGGSVNGTVTDGSAGVLNITMTAYTTDGVAVRSVFTNASGVYSILGLPTGSYLIRATPGTTSPLVGEVYNNITCVSCIVTTGTPLSVTIGVASNGIDFSLATGGSITATVTAQVGGALLQNMTVQLFSSTGVSLSSRLTSASGVATFSGVPPGSYYLRTVGGASSPYADELYNNIPFLAGNVVGSGGTPIVVTANADSAVSIALPPASVLTGSVIDGVTTAPLAAVPIRVYDSTGLFVRSGVTDVTGAYTVGSLIAGTYFVRTGNNNGYADGLFSGMPCLGFCSVIEGTGVNLAVGATVGNVNFSLSTGGRVSGTVLEDGTNAPISGLSVRLYNLAGRFVAAGATDVTGAYTTAPGIPTGTYFARTFNVSGFADKLYDTTEICVPDCKVTSGSGISVGVGATTSGVNFSLRATAELVQNGDFSSGSAAWSLFSTPTAQYMERTANGLTFQFSRVPPPAGTANQAVIFQNTGAALSAGVPIVAQFDLANSSAVRKRISVLVQDSDFLDLSVCTFWLPPNSGLTRYGMRTRTTKAWANATIAFYAASTNNPAGTFTIDNVTMQSPPSVQVLRTDCIDPTVATPTGGPNSANLLVNGNFASNALSPGWTTFGNVQSQVTSGVLEFTKLAGAPAGVVLQPTGQAVAANTLITSAFQFGNSSANRQRVTVIMHDLDFSDLSACTFWVEPGQALSNYTYRAFTTKAITNLTLSIYPATTNGGQWLRLDNASMAVTPGAPINGAECVEPGSTVP